MKAKLAILALVAALGLAVCAAAGARMAPIYRNALDDLPQRSEILKLSGRGCAREGGEGSLRITVGRRTEECAYRTPVLERNLEVAAVARLLAKTPTEDPAAEAQPRRREKLSGDRARRGRIERHRRDGRGVTVGYRMIVVRVPVRF